MNDQSELVLALLALQNGLIEENNLMTAFRMWLKDRTASLLQLLVDQHALNDEELRVLKALGGIHLKKHNDDPEQSIAAISSVSSICERLATAAKDETAIWKMLSQASIAETFDAKNTPTPISTSPLNHGNSNRISNSADRFRIIRKHAQGGLGIVFVAQDEDLRREVALKQIRTDFTSHSAMESKFNQEAQITGQLEHPGIVPVYALGTDKDGRPYYAMRFIRGEDLHSRIKSFHESLASTHLRFDGPELRGLLRRFVDICNAVHYAHDRGVLHRDLKPGNVMLGKYGETLVVDWGLAKAFSENGAIAEGAETINSELPVAGTEGIDATHQGTFVGTPAFAPPEQLLGMIAQLGPASDVYSLGAILYQLLTGRTPCADSKSFRDLVEIASTMRFKSPSQLQPEVSTRLDAICMKSLNARASDRYQSASLLANEIENWLDDEPVDACPDNLFERFSRWGRRNPSLCAAVVTVISLAISNIMVLSLVYALSY